MWFLPVLNFVLMVVPFLVLDFVHDCAFLMLNFVLMIVLVITS